MKSVNEIIQKGNAYRICIDDSDETNLRWARQSFWTAASDVEFEDGTTLEEKVDQFFQYASDGKSLIASTLTGLGVETALDATYQTMSDNIEILAEMMYNAGRTQGQQDVTSNPTKYGLASSEPMQIIVSGRMGWGDGEKAYNTAELKLNVDPVNRKTTLQNTASARVKIDRTDGGVGDYDSTISFPMDGSGNISTQ